jgi:uncharacterized membrane protein HdeD (DUF308 family)
MLRIIIKIVRAIFGGIGIIMTVVGIALLVVGIFVIIGEKQNPKLSETTITEIKAGAIMVLVGLPLFGVCAGALKRPLYFLVPIILIISFVLAGILLPESMWGIKGEYLSKKLKMWLMERPPMNN